MQPNSILFLSYWYPNKSNENFAIFIKRHAHAISLKNNIQVLAITILKGKSLFKKSVTTFTDENNVTTHQLSIESRFNKLMYVLLPLHYILINSYIIKHILPSFKFNIVHSNVTFPCAIMGYWLSKKYKVKHVISEHWSKLDKFFKLSMYKHQGKKALNNASTITCVSSFLADNLKKHTTNKNIKIVPNVINSSQFYYDTSQIKNEVFTFIAVAHWEKPKNPFYFLEALQQLVEEKKIKDFNVVLVGTGSQIGKIKHNNYTFTIEYKGNLNSKQLSTELNKCHCFLHGSDYETFSVVMIEALSCGIPCVVSPVGVATDVINSSNGFIAINTVSKWKESIVACYNTRYNEKQISEQLQNKYDSLPIAEQFNAVYTTI